MTSTDSGPAHIWLRAWEFVNRIPVRVAAVSVAMLMALLCWAFASPVASSPDDDFHIANVYCISDAESCTGYDRNRVLPCFVVDNSGSYAPDAAVPADCLNSEDQGSNRPQSPDDITYYPSGFYRLLSVFTQDTIRESVAAWRVVVAVLTLLMAVASAALSLPSWRRPLVVAWLVASVPLGMFLLSSHNPSALALVGAAAAVGPGTALLEERGTTVTTVLRLLLVFFCLLLMLGGRSEGLVFAAFTLGVTILLGLMRVSKTTLAIGAALIVALAPVLWLSLSAFWAKARLALALDTGGPGQPLWDGLTQSLGALTGSYGSPLGWLEIGMPTLVTVVAGAAFWGTIALGFAVMSWGKALATATVAAAIVGISAVGYITSAPYIQVRQYLPLIYLLVIAALAPVGGRGLPDWGRAQWWALCTALTVANSVALLYLSVRYISGISPGTTAASALASAPTPTWWWGTWFGPFANWLVGSLAFGAVVALLPSLLMRFERDAADESIHETTARHQRVEQYSTPAA